MVRSITRYIGTAAMAVVLSACGSSQPSPSVDPCEAPLGGPVWDDPSLPEAQAGLEPVLAAADIGSLPARLTTDGLYAMDSAALAYALETPEALIIPELERWRIANAGPELGHGVLASFAVNGAQTLDRNMLRRVLHRYYACDRSHPRTLADFRVTYGDYLTFERRELSESVPKRSERTLFEDPEAGVYVAESLDSQGRRETEVILENHRRDGALDFLVYDHAGQLRDRAPLAMGSAKTVLPAPYACMMCHRNLTTNRIDVVDPSNP